MSTHPQDWYGDGLRFACTRCGNCCRGEGYVWVDADAISGIADHLAMPTETFTREFVRRVGDRFSLVDKPNLDCVFWDSQEGCQIYPVRPTQCGTFPFWKDHLQTRGAWEAASSECPGMNRGPLHDATEIRRILGGD